MICKLLRHIALFVLTSYLSAGWATGLGTSNGSTDPNSSAGAVGCNNAHFFGAAFIDDICWDLVATVHLAGVWGNSDQNPDAANKNPFCSCKDGWGVPTYGLSIGGWLPYRVFEAVRNPYCSPVLGGIFLSKNVTNLAGPGGDLDKHGDPKQGYWHVHALSFPLLEMMNMLTGSNCNPGGYSDMDFIMLSELDPTVSDGELSMLFYAETAMFANPLAVAACGAECALISAGVKPQPGGFFWCEGCWGSMYPLTNSVSNNRNPSLSAYQAVTRTLALKHRRGLGEITYGEANMCGGLIYPFVPKEQYRWQQFYPYPNAATGSCSHWTGTSTFETGDVSRDIPDVGEDRVFLLYRYVDCCDI